MVNENTVLRAPPVRLSMDRASLLKAIRAPEVGYTGADDQAAVRSFVDAQGIALTDTAGTALSFDDVWGKVPVQRKTLALAPTAVETASTSTARAAVAQVNAENMGGGDPAKRGTMAMTPANWRSISARRNYDRKAKAGIRGRIDPHTGAVRSGATAFESADLAEYVGACARMKVWQERGLPRYDEYANDMSIINNGNAEMWGRAQTTYQDSTGGALIPPLQYIPDLINLREQYGVIRSLARVWDMGNQLKDIFPKTNDPVGSTMYKVSDNTAITQSTANFQTVTLDAAQFGMLAQAPIRLVRTSALDIADVMAQFFAQGWAYNEDNVCFNGDGGSTYFGFVGLRTAIASSASNVGLVTQATGNTYGALVLKDFQRLCSVMPEAFQMGATFVMHRRFYYEVVYPLLTSLGGVPLGEVAAGAPASLFGYPVRFSQVMPSTTATSQVCCLFGNFSLGAYFGDVSALTDFATSDQRYFDQAAVAYRSLQGFGFNCQFGVGDTSYAGPICALRTGS